MLNVFFFSFQTWTKCTVKIEAIKYIPCFVKITLMQKDNDEKSNVVIKINIPGLGVQLASSRSKAYSYGLFWTQHRKNCCIFFALDSKVNLERHINWIQSSITNLEIHRRGNSDDDCVRFCQISPAIYDGCFRNVGIATGKPNQPN